jgi:hypothetical protein
MPKEAFAGSHDTLKLASWTARVNDILDGKLRPGHAAAVLAACAAEADARDVDVDQSWTSLVQDMYGRFKDSNGDRRCVAALQLESMAAVADGDVGAGF